MAFSEKLYLLRKKSGLSQEQLAEQLGVSRQAISKWESGQSVPECDRLIVISSYFKVSLDDLLKEDNKQPAVSDAVPSDHPPQTGKKTRWLPGIVCCIGGVVCLIFWGLLPILNPNASNLLRESSMIHIDGTGIFLILCIAAIVVGAVLLLKDARKSK